jgi:hypothetical protein
MVGEDTQSSSGASGLGGRGRAARVGRIVTLGPRRIALPGFIGAARARLFENDIRDPSFTRLLN